MLVSLEIFHEKTIFWIIEYFLKKILNNCSFFALFFLQCRRENGFWRGRFRTPYFEDPNFERFLEPIFQINVSVKKWSKGLPLLIHFFFLTFFWRFLEGISHNRTFSKNGDFDDYFFRYPRDQLFRDFWENPGYRDCTFPQKQSTWGEHFGGKTPFKIRSFWR